MGMGTGQKSIDKGVSNAAQPTNYRDGNASYTGTRSDMVYRPKENDSVGEQRGMLDNKLLNVTRGIPTATNMNEAFNNPFAKTLQTLNRQSYAENQRTLDNDLNAKGLVGGSYDISSKRELGRRRTEGDLQARMAGFDAFSQNLNNQLQTLGALRQDKSQGLDQYYTPLKYALQGGANNVPLQQTMAGQMAKRKTGWQMYMDYQKQNAEMAGAIFAGMKGG